MKKNDKSPRLSIGEVAELMGVHVTTVRRIADSGDLKYVRTPGGHRRFAMSDVAPFIPEAMKHMAIYVQYGQQDAIHRIAGLLEKTGRTPKMSIEERSADLTRPLYGRPGIIRMAEYAGKGLIQGFATPDESLVGGWDQYQVLVLMDKLGLSCFIAEEKDIRKFPV